MTLTAPVLNDPMRYRARGGAVEMFASVAPEILYEGPANAGKTMALVTKSHALAEKYPGVRILWLRKTRKSLSQSVLVTFEQRVLPPGHPCIHGTASREHRDGYKYPNGSEIVLGGMDNPDKVMSTEYDFICYFEATEGTLDEWLRLITRVRNKQIYLGNDKKTGKPVYFHQMVADCNPGTAYHWLNRRAKDGAMHRIRARHTDNPRFGAEDQARLDSLTGVARKRLRDGLWCAESGQVLDCWDADRMMCYRRDLLLDKTRPTGGYKFEWTFGALDFGMKDAQVFQVWGVLDDAIYMVAEYYRRGLNTHWWGNQIAKEMDRWQLASIVADGGGLGATLISDLNDYLGPMGGNFQNGIIRPATKGKGSVMAGLKQVQAKMESGQLFLCHDALESGACPESMERYLPTCTAEEIPAYVWARDPEGSPRDMPDPKCEDHGIDAMRYAVTFKWGRDLGEEPEIRSEPGTLGDLLGHDAWLASLDAVESTPYDDEALFR